MKKSIIYFSLLLTGLLSHPTFSQNVPDVLKSKEGKTIFRSKNGETFTLYTDQTFVIMHYTGPMHIRLRRCDTIAKGKWSVIDRSIIKLSEDPEEVKVTYNLTKESRYSKDSVYFKIVLPDSTFDQKRFRFGYAFLLTSTMIDSDVRTLAVPRQKVVPPGSTVSLLSLWAQDLTPSNVGLFKKCYQHTDFNFGDNIYLDPKFNFFTISVPSFTDCFVHRAAVDNDYIFLTKDNLHWQDMDFKKVK